MYEYCRPIVVIMVMFFVIMISPLSAQDSLLMNYQGSLSNNIGEPLTGNFNITFRIYATSTGGTSLWNETHYSVPVSNGLLSIVLGSQSTLMNSILDGSDRYLGITIGTDPELSPRSLLTSSPNAAVAGKIIGDIQTSPGAMLINNDAGDSSIVFRSIPNLSSLRLFDPQSDPSGLSVLELSSSAFNGTTVQLFDPDPEPPKRTIELQSGFNNGATINLFDPDPDPPRTTMELRSGLNSGPSIKLFDALSESPKQLFELVATSGSGASMGFFNQAGQVMGVEPSPFNTGFSWRMFDPQPEPPGKMFEILTSFGQTKSVSGSNAANSTTMNMYSNVTGTGDQELITLSVTGSDAEMRMGLGAPSGSSTSYVSIESDASSSSIEVIGPSGPIASFPISITSDLTGARIGIGTSTPSQALHVVGDICYTGSIGACSDESFKKDIEPIENALESVDQINGVMYSWRTDEFPNRQFKSDRQVGLIAQQVKEVLPEAVTLQDDGYYTIDYSRLTPLLLEAIKELKHQNDDLIKRLEVLEKKND